MIKFDREKNTDIEDKNIDFNIKKVLECIKKKENITQKELAEHLNTAKMAVERAISFLKQQGYIERVGNNCSGYWKILK